MLDQMAPYRGCAECVLSLLLLVTPAVCQDHVQTSEDGFYDQVERMRMDLSPEEWQAAWQQWVESQAPLVTTGELTALAISKRDSVVSLCVSSTVRTQSFVESFGPSSSRQEDVIWSDIKVYRRIQSLDDPRQTLIRAYDGSVVRTLTKLESQRAGRGRISLLETLAPFAATYDPLVASMLVESQRLFSTEWLLYDLVACLGNSHTYLLSETVSVNGSECIALVCGTPGVFRVFLDIDRDFAVVRVEAFTMESKGGTRFGRELRYLRVLDAFQDCGNGLWLPTVIRQEWYSTSKHTEPSLCDTLLRAEREATVTTLSLNEQIPDERFTDIFALGAFVRDDITGVSYQVADVPSIDSTIKAAVRGASTGIARSGHWNRFADLIGVASMAVVSFMTIWLSSRKRRLT